MSPIPITIITGFLGSGKTTLILNLIPQLPKTYRLALLKNEYGDLAIDSQLASSSAISGVQELLNGCICCNLVGQLSEALETLRKDVNPDRIVIETSGSAFPATLAMEVNRLVKETGGAYSLDGVLSVIDVENWKGYEDTSYTAKIQARYTDLIVLNKWEKVSERRVDEVEDRLLDLEVDPPIPRTKSRKGWVEKDLVFGLDATFSQLEDAKTGQHDHEHEHAHDHQSEIEVLSVTLPAAEGADVDLDKLENLLKAATKDEVYRMKAVLYSTARARSSDDDGLSRRNDDADSSESPGPSRYILNWAFGRWTYTRTGGGAQKGLKNEPALRMTVMTARYESTKWKKAIEAGKYVVHADGSTSGLLIEKIA